MQRNKGNKGYKMIICWCCGYPTNKKDKCHGRRVGKPCRLYNVLLAECSTPYIKFRKNGNCKGKIKAIEGIK